MGILVVAALAILPGYALATGSTRGTHPRSTVGAHRSSATTTKSLISAFNPHPIKVPMPGDPGAVVTTHDGKYVFVGLAGSVLGGPALGGTELKTVEGIEILEQNPDGSVHVLRVFDTGRAILGLTVTNDGQYLLAGINPDDADDTEQIINIQQAIDGAANPVVASVPTGEASGPAQSFESTDGKYVFVTNEEGLDLTVINLASALATGGGAGSVVATIGLDLLPVGVDISPDGRYLYVTNEESARVGGSPVACGDLPQGSLDVISTARAEAGSNSAIIARIPAGCSPVRVEVSADGGVVYVTSRGSDSVIAFNAAKLLSDPTHAIISTTPVGLYPVGLQLFDNGQLLAVANSNRGGRPPNGTLSILDTATALAGGGKAATLLNEPAGQFPREIDLSPNGTLLYLAEFDSQTLEIFQVTPTTTSTTSAAAVFRAAQNRRLVAVHATLPTTAARFTFTWQKGVSFGAKRTSAYIKHELAIYPLPRGTARKLIITDLSKNRARVGFRLVGTSLSHLNFLLRLRSLAVSRTLTAHHVKSVTGTFTVTTTAGTAYRKTITYTL